MVLPHLKTCSTPHFVLGKEIQVFFRLRVDVRLLFRAGSPNCYVQWTIPYRLKLNSGQAARDLHSNRILQPRWLE